MSGGSGMGQVQQAGMVSVTLCLWCDVSRLEERSSKGLLHAQPTTSCGTPE